MRGQQFTEAVVEEAALAWLEALSFTILHGPDMAAGRHAVPCNSR
jgi:uncharacterized MnhB-related membrane protein